MVKYEIRELWGGDLGKDMIYSLNQAAGVALGYETRPQPEDFVLLLEGEEWDFSGWTISWSSRIVRFSEMSEKIIKSIR
jgi:hypothetical protein